MSPSKPLWPSVIRFGIAEVLLAHPAFGPVFRRWTASTLRLSISISTFAVDCFVDGQRAPFARVYPERSTEHPSPDYRRGNLCPSLGFFSFCLCRGPTAITSLRLRILSAICEHPSPDGRPQNLCAPRSLSIFPPLLGSCCASQLSADIFVAEHKHPIT